MCEREQERALSVLSLLSPSQPPTLTSVRGLTRSLDYCDVMAVISIRTHAT